MDCNACNVVVYETGDHKGIEIHTIMTMFIARMMCLDLLLSTLFSKRKVSLIYTQKKTVLKQYPLGPTLESGTCIRCMTFKGPVAYNLPQKKSNLQKLTFLLEKSV